MQTFLLLLVMLRQFSPMRLSHVPDDRESRPLNTPSAASVQSAATTNSFTNTRPPSLMTAAVQPTVAATAESGETPASMKEGSLVLMYGDCCPGMHCTRAADVPNQVTFAMTYVDPQDSHLFWAALLYGKRVCCDWRWYEAVTCAWRQRVVTSEYTIGSVSRRTVGRYYQLFHQHSSTFTHDCKWGDAGEHEGRQSGTDVWWLLP